MKLKRLDKTLLIMLFVLACAALVVCIVRGDDLQVPLLIAATAVFVLIGVRMRDVWKPPPPTRRDDDEDDDEEV